MREKRFNLIHRLLHWLIAFTLLYVLLTVFLRLGWMNKDQIGHILTQDLQKKGIKISNENAVTIAKAIRKPMWSTHIIAGYVMIGLYLIRIIVTSIQGIAYQNPFSKLAPVKEKIKSFIYIVFYVLLAITLFTGFMLINGPKEWKAIMSLTHDQSLYYVVIFIVLHIGGVLLADAGSQKGIISKIISGD